MDWQLTCRVCLETGDMVSLLNWDKNNKQLSDKYTYCCGVEVTKDDCLPMLICLNCVDRLTFAYEFKVQCISSIDTLKECLEEFVKSTTAVKSAKAAQDVSPYQRKKPKVENKEPEALTKLLESGSLELKTEPADEETLDDFGGDDPDFIAAEDGDSEYEPPQETQLKKRGRPRKIQEKTKKSKPDDGEDVLLKETIMASAEPIPDHILNPKPKKKYPSKKKYSYDKTYVCETCDKTFSSKNALQIHVRRHLGIRPFECTICGYAFVLKPELRKHMWSHTGYSPYKCSMCDRRFRDMGSRQKHERVHMGLKPYKCTMCDKAFNYSYGLNAHMVTHTGEKKYSCDQCNKRFTRSAQVSIHNKRYHKELYQQQKLQADIKRSRQRADLSGIFTAAQGRGSDEEYEKEHLEDDLEEITVKVERD